MERKIVAINGTIGSGKDTIAKAFINNGFKQMSFAESLKDAVSSIFGWEREMLEGSTEESRKIRETKDEYWSNELGYEVTQRFILQHLGTDVLREHFCNDLWILSLKKKILSTSGNIIITDCRFPNEIIMLRTMNSILVEVQRVLPEWYNDAVKYNNFVLQKREEIKNISMGGHQYEDFEIMIEASMPKSLDNIHKSEYAWVGINKPDYVVQNNKGIEDLQYKALEIISKI